MELACENCGCTFKRKRWLERHLAGSVHLIQLGPTRLQPRCRRGCGFETSRWGRIPSHERVCTYPHTIERICEIGKIDTSDPNSCWEWHGVDGLGSVKAQRLGHPRSVYQTVHQVKLGKHEYVCHFCDNPRCINPAHLWIGTPKDNMHDMIKKDRQYKPTAEELAARGAKRSAAHAADPAMRERAAAAARLRWQSPEYVEKQRQAQLAARARKRT